MCDKYTNTQNDSIWFGFRSEQFFGSPTEAATAAEGIRERLLLVEERRLQLQEMGLCHEEEVPTRQDAWLAMIGEDLREKEEQDDVEEEKEEEEEVEEEEEEEGEEEEEEQEGQEDEDLARATQDC